LAVSTQRASQHAGDAKPSCEQSDPTVQPPSLPPVVPLDDRPDEVLLEPADEPPLLLAPVEAIAELEELVPVAVPVPRVDDEAVLEAEPPVELPLEVEPALVAAAAASQYPAALQPCPAGQAPPAPQYTRAPLRLKSQPDKLTKGRARRPTQRWLLTTSAPPRCRVRPQR
jgi:hypothetical protein